MTDFERLEAMGYRFKLDGERIAYKIYGGSPPPGGAALLKGLDREEVKRILQDRAAGLKASTPAELDQGWPPRLDLPAEKKSIFRVAYDFCRRWHNQPKDWERICEDMNQLSQGAPQLLRDILIAIYEELEREQQAERESGGTGTSAPS